MKALEVVSKKIKSIKMIYCYIFYIFLIVIISMTVILSLSKNKITYKNGDIIGQLVFKNFHGEKVSLIRGKYNFVIYLKSLEKGFSLAKYIDKLLQRFGSSGLNIVLITPFDRDGTQNPDMNIDFKYPVLPVEENRAALKAFFDLDQTEQCLLIINPGLVLDAVFYFFREEDVRQLCEKYLLGDIAYQEQDSTGKLKVGDSFPVIDLEDLTPGTSMPVTQTSGLSPHLWFVFNSNCVTCVLHNQLVKFKELEDEIGKTPVVPLGLMFSSYFFKSEVLENINYYSIKTRAFLAVGELTGIEDSYFKASAESGGLVILTSVSNQILYLAPFLDFIGDFKGGKIDFKSALR